MTIKELYEGSLDFINIIVVKSYGETILSTFDTESPPLAKLALLCAFGDVPVDKYFLTRNNCDGSTLTVQIDDTPIARERIFYRHFMNIVNEEISTIKGGVIK